MFLWEHFVQIVLYVHLSAGQDGFCTRGFPDFRIPFLAGVGDVPGGAGIVWCSSSAVVAEKGSSFARGTAGGGCPHKSITQSSLIGL
jgi:hypothetical protein